MKREMRRKERQVTDMTEILEIIKECDVCRLGFCDEGEAYIVPLNFGYTFENDTLRLFFHSAREGRKVDCIRKGGRVSFEMDCGHRLLDAKTEACKSTMFYRSVMGVGTVRPLTKEETLDGLRIIMSHYSEATPEFDHAVVERAFLFTLTVEDFTAKAH